jgi:hypothetical protein
MEGDHQPSLVGDLGDRDRVLRPSPARPMAGDGPAATDRIDRPAVVVTKGTQSRNKTESVCSGGTVRKSRLCGRRRPATYARCLTKSMALARLLPSSLASVRASQRVESCTPRELTLISLEPVRVSSRVQVSMVTRWVSTGSGDGQRFAYRAANGRRPPTRKPNLTPLRTSGTPTERKAAIETLIAEVRLTDQGIVPVFKIPTDTTMPPPDPDRGTHDEPPVRTMVRSVGRAGLEPATEGL